MAKTKKVKNIVKEAEIVSNTKIVEVEDKKVETIVDEVKDEPQAESNDINVEEDVVENKQVDEASEAKSEDNWDNFKKYETEKGVYDFTDASTEDFEKAVKITNKEDKVMVGNEASEFERQKKIEKNRMITYTWNGQIYDF